MRREPSIARGILLALFGAVFWFLIFLFVGYEPVHLAIVVGAVFLLAATIQAVAITRRSRSRSRDAKGRSEPSQ